LTVTAYVITPTLQTNWIETVAGHPKHRLDRSSFVAVDEHTVRIARGHAYLTRSGAFRGLLKRVFLALKKKGCETYPIRAEPCRASYAQSVPGRPSRLMH
jgi:hypothetical protein